uniref:Uncharacterized protein n=1 Tax=Mola mola TaxID=94237 RepID=A0A3Q4BPX7_MOLML
MFAASCLLTEDQFLCSICLDVFTDPVTTPCGHNFCKTCICQHWNINVPCQCPNFTKPGETHLEPHLLKSGLRRHQLTEPTDRMCVCMLCTVLDHKTHNVVPLEEEYEAVIERMIQVKQLKIEVIKRSVVYNQEGADREIADGIQVFSALKESVEKRQAELVDSIKEKQRTMETEAKAFIIYLKQEICELKMRSCEVEQLSKSEDHLHLLQSFLSFKPAQPSKDRTGVSIRPASYEGSVARAVKQLEETIMDVTLDHNTAHPCLILSEDGKQVHFGDVWKTLPKNPNRFDTCVFVLAMQSFSSGRFYYEVHVKGNTEWALGVARDSINRKGIITASPQNGYWTIWLRSENEYIASAHPSVRLSLKSRPEKVGVFVDYEEGLVSFYDVNAAAVMYSFTLCCFTDKIYPIFYPCPQHSGKHSTPLTISPTQERNQSQK